VNQKRHGWNGSEEYNGEHQECFREAIHARTSTREMLCFRRPGGYASNRRLKIVKFLIQDPLFNRPADTLVAGLSPPPIDQLKQCVAASEAKLKGLVQCLPPRPLPQAD